MSILVCPKCTVFNNKNDNYCVVCDYQFENEKTKEKNISENFEKAYEKIPEYFIQQKLLYIDGNINNIDISFLLDTGAMVSVMDYNIMKTLSLEKYSDDKCKGEMVGVGNKKIEGKIYYTEILFDFGYVPSSFTVIKDLNLVILGMDFIKSHGLILDFKNKIIKIGENEIKMKL